MQPFLLFFSALFPALAAKEAETDGLFGGPLRNPIEPDTVDIFSVANDNQRYQVHFTTRSRLWGRQPLFLSVGDQLIEGGWGSDSNTTWSLFTLDAAQAEAIAQRYGVPLRKRAPLGEGITATWSLEGTVVKLTLANEGAPVGVWVNGIPTTDSGGHGQLGFHVLEAGVEVGTPGPQGIYVGPVGVRRLGPGEPLVLDADLAKLFPLKEDGHYEIRCRYDGVAVVGDTLPAYPEQAHQAWTLVFEGTLALAR